MSEEAHRGNLRVVRMDPQSGEIVDERLQRDEYQLLRNELQQTKEQLADASRIIIGLERDLNAGRIRERKLLEDKAQEAREHYLWPLIALVYVGYQKRCGKRAVFTPGRFWAAEPYFRLTTYGKTLEVRVGRICRAIAGAQFDAGTKRYKNGRRAKYDDWENNIFVNNGRFEEYCERAPLDFEFKPSPRLLDAIRVAEDRGRRMNERKAAERQEAM